MLMGHRSAVLVVTGALVACAGADVKRPPRNADADPPRTSAAPPSATSALPSRSARSSAPSTARQAVTDTYHGVSVTDDYRWLEDGDAPAVRAWSAAQNAHTRESLDAIPGYAQIRARVSEVSRYESARYFRVIPRKGRWFVLVFTPPRQQPRLAVMAAGADPKTARVLVDPNELDASGKTSIDWFVPSPDASRLAVSMSRAGTELGDLTLVDVKTGKTLPDMIPRVNGGTAGGDLAWAPDGSGFFYTRYPEPGQRPPKDANFYQQVYFHALAKPVSGDRFEFGDGLPKIAEIQLDADERSARVLASVQRGDGGEFSHFIRLGEAKWQRLTDFGDGITEIRFGATGELYLLSRKGSARGKILRLPRDVYVTAQAAEVVPEREETLVSSFWGDGTFLASSTHLYATYQLGGPSAVRAFDWRGKPSSWAAPLEVASTSGLSRTQDGGVLFRSESFLDPSAFYRFDEKTRTTKKTLLVDGAAIDLSGYRVVRELATSRDGTRVPLNLLLPKDVKLDGSNPCVVTGYGGYGNSLEPQFRSEVGIWLEHGVIFVVANLRGGGEFGEDWHRQGNLERKQNVFDDFAAVLQHLIARGYTRAERLGITGGSNGGLLMGAMLAQHPELFKAAVSSVGIYDMLRSELSPNGAFNVTEFGTVRDPRQFAALYAYSPYHHVRDGVAYPATLLMTGENDPRVDPMHSRKMAARLQAATGGTAPILFRSSAGVGHGGGTGLDERIAQKSDLYAFLLHELGVTVVPKTQATP